MSVSFSDITQAVDFTFVFVLVISVVLMVGITGALVTFVIKYHRTRHPVAAQVESHPMLEVIWTVIPTFLALSMFYFGWVGYRLMRTPPLGAMEVTALGRMWSWEFEYENGKNSTELYLPVGKPVKVNVESADVIHSFYVPAFRVKQDCIPNLDEFVWFEPKETGTYDIFCAEYCGLRHSYMLSKVVVVPADEFLEWVETDVEVVVAEEGASEEERIAAYVRLGERLSETKGCNACHSVDGTKLVGPTYKGLFGRTSTVITNGKRRHITVDEEYVRNSILRPNDDLVEGYQPVMPPQELSDDELTALVEYLKTL